MSGRKIGAIFRKQIKETLENKVVLIQFLMFPVITVVMQQSIDMEGMPENFFVTLFGTMYIGMAPLTAMASIISEEKEKNTLRVLLMSNVKAGEYLLGVGFYVVLCCLAGAAVIASQGGYDAAGMLRFLGTMLIGIVLSVLLGAVIGSAAGNQMAATSLVVPLMCVCSFLPMLAYFNKAIARVSRFFYTQQIYNWLTDPSRMRTDRNSWVIVAVNFAVALGLFIVLYRKKGLES